MVTGAALTARRHARELVGDMRWRGMPVPPLYARMAGEFDDLVRSGDYAAWVATNQTPSLDGRRPRARGLRALRRPDRPGVPRGTPRGGVLLPGPISGG